MFKSNVCSSSLSFRLHNSKSDSIKFFSLAISIVVFLVLTKALLIHLHLHNSASIVKTDFYSKPSSPPSVIPFSPSITIYEVWKCIKTPSCMPVHLEPTPCKWRKNCNKASAQAALSPRTQLASRCYLISSLWLIVPWVMMTSHHYPNPYSGDFYNVRETHWATHKL